MKRLIFCDTSYLRFYLTLFTIFLFIGVSFGQQSATKQEGVAYLEPGYYAVVGVFKYPKNAVNYAGEVRDMGENSSYAYYPPRGFYYVQIGKFDSFQKARIKAIETRKKHQLDSTWVYKAQPYTLSDGQTIGADVKMDVGIGLEYKIERDTANITKVFMGSPSYRSGIKKDDKIISVDDDNIAGVSLTQIEVNEILLGMEGSTVKLTVMRDGKLQDFNMSREQLQNYTVSREELLKSKELIGMDYEIRQDTVFITSVNPGGKADKMGIRVGDKLIEIAEESVSGVNVSQAQISQSLSQVVEKGAVVTVLRNGVEHEYFISSEDLDESKKAGIGIKFEIRNDSVYVTKILEGGSAGIFGLLEGDQIIKIDGINVTGINVTDVEVSDRLSGDEGTTVSLSILRNGEEQELVVERGIIPSGFDIEISTQVIGVHHLKSIEDIKGVRMFFNTFRADNLKDVPGRIEIINPDKPQRFAFEEVHKVVGVPLSINRSGNVELICEIFGYKKVQHDFNLNSPITERSDPYLSHEQEILIVDFELNRYTKGDLVTMYNVYFFKDAAIMRPESKYELQQLIEMLNENPDYKISIMGHTNGNNSGPIIEMPDGSVNYFSNAGQKKEGWGSAKKLSSKRAELIMEYLVFQNINSNRMEAKGYGGKRSIYDKFDNLAYKNVRVEIEILAD